MCAYQHNPPYKGSITDGFIIKPHNGPCDCVHAENVTSVDPDTPILFNENSCFSAVLDKIFWEKPYEFANYQWRGPGRYVFRAWFVAKTKAYHTANSYSWPPDEVDHSNTDTFLYPTCIRILEDDVPEGTGLALARRMGRLNGPDYIKIIEEPPDILFDFKSSDLSGQSSLVNEWVYSTSWVNGMPQNTISKFSQATTSKQPENIQQLIRYDQGLPIESAVSFEVDDHLRGDILIHGSNNDLNFAATGKFDLFIVAEPTSGEENNTLISFEAQSSTPSGFSFQAISGQNYNGVLTHIGEYISGLNSCTNPIYPFAYDNIEPGPSVYHFHFDNENGNHQCSINGNPLVFDDAYFREDTFSDFELPREGRYHLGSGFKGKIYQILGVRDFGRKVDVDETSPQFKYLVDVTAQEYIEALALKWGIGNKLPDDSLYKEAKMFGVFIENQQHFKIEGLDSFNSGETATIDIQQNRGIQFSGLSGQEIYTEESITNRFRTFGQNAEGLPDNSYQSNIHRYEFLMTGDHIVTGIYENLPQYTLEISGSGTHYGDGVYFSGENIGILTEPENHFQKFVEWESGVTDIPFPSRYDLINLTGDTTLNAKYRLKYYFDVLLEGEGQQSGSGTFLEDDIVTVTGYAPQYKHLSGWSFTSGTGDIYEYLSTGNELGFKLTTGAELTAYYELDQYKINARAAYDNGSVSGVENGTFFDVEVRTYTGTQQVQLTGVPGQGYAFSYWDTGDTNYYSNEVLDLTVTGDMDIGAAFIPEYEFKPLNYSGIFSGGYISGTETGIVRADQKVSYSAEADPGFEFDQWIVENISDDINFLQVASSTENVSIDGFNLSHDSSTTNTGLFKPIHVPTPYFKDLNRKGGSSVYDSFYPILNFEYDVVRYEILNNSSNGYFLNRRYKVDNGVKVDLRNTKFSLNNTFGIEAEVINFSIPNPLIHGVTHGDPLTDPLYTIYDGYSSNQVLDDDREKISTNWAVIEESSLNSNNPILTFKASFIAYKESSTITPNIKLELFPCKVETRNSKPEILDIETDRDYGSYAQRELDELYAIYDQQYHEDSIKDRSFRGAYFDLENSKLHKGKNAPAGFNYTYEMIQVFEDSEHIEYSISVSITAENGHASAYTLFIQPFTVNNFNKLDDYNIKFGIKNLFFGQLASRSAIAFGQKSRPQFLNKTLSSDFSPSALFKKVNPSLVNETNSLTHNLPFTPELSKEDLSIEGSRLFVFGKHQTEAPMPNNFKENDQYKIGLNDPDNHTFSRYRAIGKGIRSDVGFFELIDQDISLESLFAEKETALLLNNSNLDEGTETFKIGSQEFYNFFGAKWKDKLRTIEKSEYMAGYEGVGRENFEEEHYFEMNLDDFNEVKLLMSEQNPSRSIEAELKESLKLIYDNDPYIESYEFNDFQGAERLGRFSAILYIYLEGNYYDTVVWNEASERWEGEFVYIEASSYYSFWHILSNSDDSLLAESQVPPYYISNRRADGPYSNNYFVRANYKYIESIIKVQLPKFYTFKDNAAYSDFLEEFSHRYSFELSDMKGYGGRISDIHEDSIPYRHYHKLDPILTYIKLERSEEDIAELIENGLTEEEARALPLELEGVYSLAQAGSFYSALIDIKRAEGDEIPPENLSLDEILYELWYFLNKIQLDEYQVTPSLKDWAELLQQEILDAVDDRDNGGRVAPDISLNLVGIRPIAVYSRRRADWHNLDKYYSNLYLKRPGEDRCSHIIHKNIFGKQYNEFFCDCKLDYYFNKHNISHINTDVDDKFCGYSQNKNINWSIIKPYTIANINNSAIKVTSIKLPEKKISFKPASTNLSFDCKLMQSNIKENSLRYLIQSQKENLRLQPSISWTSTDSENLSDATFRFKAAVSDSKDLFKIYRVLTDNSEKYIGQMSCLDVNEGEFIINWDGDLTEANISTTNFNRSSNNFNISHQFSLIKESFKHKTDNSFYVMKANNGVIEPVPSLDQIIEKYQNALSNSAGKYSWDSKSILTVDHLNYLGTYKSSRRLEPDYTRYFPYDLTQHYLLGKGNPTKITSEYHARWYTLMISLLSIQEFMQDYFSTLSLQGNKKRHVLSSFKFAIKDDPIYRERYWPSGYRFGGNITYVLRIEVDKQYGHIILPGDEIYPGIEIDYNSMDDYFLANFQNNNINLPTIATSIISTNVSNTDDVVEFPVPVDGIGDQLNIQIDKQLITKEKCLAKVRDPGGSTIPTVCTEKAIDKLIFNYTSMDLKNNFVFTNPDLTWEQEHFNVLENILMSCELLDISNEYNKLSRAHWSEATPSSVIESLNDRFTTVTFENQDIHIEVIYDE